MTAASDDDGDPIARLQRWVKEAEERSGLDEPSAMVLATVDAQGRPSARVVLLRGLDERGLAFYTNRTSRKARELVAQPVAAVCIYWERLGRQLRVEGRIEPVSDEEAQRYWSHRPRESQLGAWASHQSAALADRAELDAAVARMEARFVGQPVPLPDFWGGLRLVPDRIEFWQRGAARLHDRDEYRLASDGSWQRGKLYP